jgi:sec-independent protein translocase protein TatA
MFGQMDLIVIGGLALLLFGPKKIPDLMKGLGLGIKEFKKVQSELEEEVQKPIVSYDKPEKQTVTEKQEQSGGKSV